MDGEYDEGRETENIELNERRQQEQTLSVANRKQISVELTPTPLTSF